MENAAKKRLKDIRKSLEELRCQSLPRRQQNTFETLLKLYQSADEQLSRSKTVRETAHSHEAEEKDRNAFKQHQLEKSSPSEFGQLLKVMLMQQAQQQSMFWSNMMLKSVSNEHGSFPAMFNPMYGQMNQQPSPLASQLPKNGNLIARNVTINRGKMLRNAPEEAQTQHQPLLYHCPFPGHEEVQKLRKLGYAILFALIVAEDRGRFNSQELFEMDLANAVSVAERRHLQASSPISALVADLADPTGGRSQFHVFLQPKPNSKALKSAKNDLTAALVTVTEWLAVFPWEQGTLTLGEKGIFRSMFERHRRYPKGYFHSLEQAELMFAQDETPIAPNFKPYEVKLLVEGLVFFRGLVVNIMCKPEAHKLIKTEAYEAKKNAQANFKIFAALLLYLYCHLLGEARYQRTGRQKNSPVEYPDGFQGALDKMEFDKLIKKIGRKFVENAFVSLLKTF